MSNALLQHRDYTVIIAKTTARVQQAPPGFELRWQNAQAAIFALIQKCEEFAPEGITIYIASKRDEARAFRQYKQVKANEVQQVFQENYPPETLNLLDGIEAVLTSYFERKVIGQTKPNGEIVLILIDGEPEDRMAIAKAIAAATHKLDRDDELGIGFVQIGDDAIARGFLESLDHDLKTTAGAKFDIVNTRILEQIEPDCLTEFLLDVLHD